MYSDSIARAFDSNAPLCTAEERSRRRKAPGQNYGFDIHQYDGIAGEYMSPKEFPHGKIEKALLQKGLGDCAGQRILNIAGGTGDHARYAIEAGAERIDVVDISEPMMEVGKQIEEKAGRDKIHWYCGDMIPPLWEQLPELPIQGYDIIIAFWPFEQCETIEEYFGIWRNISAYLRPGGRLVGCRVINPWSSCVHDGKYGARVTLIEQTPSRAVKCQIIVNTKPPFTFWSCSTEASLRGDTYIPTKLGITDIQNLDPKETEIFKEDPEFWKGLVEDPYFVVFTGRKFAPQVTNK